MKRQLVSILLSLSLSLSGVATTATELEEKENAVNDLNHQVDAVSSQITDTTKQINETRQSIEKAKLDLASALVAEENQYDSMKERIKFMYEGGDLSLLEILCSSESMGDFLNKAEYVQNISSYDRKMLKKLKKASATVKKREKSLENEQEELSSLQSSLKSQQNTLKEQVEDAKLDLADYKEQLASELSSEAESTENTDSSSDTATSSTNTDIKPDNKETSVSATDETTALLAGILECEAGVSYEGMIAVGTVIMNRVNSPKFPNTIKGVIYQSGQFSPVTSGKLNRTLQRGASASAYKAARAVLNGERNSKVRNCLFFWASYTGHKGTVVGDNVFW